VLAVPPPAQCLGRGPAFILAHDQVALLTLEPGLRPAAYAGGGRYESTLLVGLGSIARCLDLIVRPALQSGELLIDCTFVRHPLLIPAE
jgi:hypothetical protein